MRLEKSRCCCFTKASHESECASTNGRFRALPSGVTSAALLPPAGGSAGPTRQLAGLAPFAYRFDGLARLTNKVAV